MKKYTLYAITAAGSAMFTFSMLLLANAVVRTLRGGMPEITLFDRPTLRSTVISIDDLCEWQNIPRMYITSASWQNGDPALPVISDDRQYVYVGNQCGVLEVTVGSAPDVILPDDTVTVTVEPHP